MVRPPGSARDAVIAILWEEDGEEKRLQSESAYRVCVHVHIRAGVQRGRAEGVGGVGGGGRVPVRSGASWSVSRNDT